jgi:hypothetical protein
VHKIFYRCGHHLAADASATPAMRVNKM